MKRQGTQSVDVQEDRFTPDQVLRLHRLARELRIMNQILSPYLDALTIQAEGHAPAWTTLDGEHITLNLSKLPFPDGKIALAIWLGVNAHELFHSKRSPRKDSPLMQRVIPNDRFMPGLMRLHNIVEDQRIERFGIAEYAPWKPYLVAALSHLLKADDASAWLLMAGRTWLPQATRDEARARFVKANDESMATEVAQLIGDYQRLLDPGWGEVNEAWSILERLHALLEANMPKLPDACTVCNDGGEPDTDAPPTQSLPPTADEAEDERQNDGGSDAKDQDDAQADDNAKDKGKPDPKDQGEPEDGGNDGGGTGSDDADGSSDQAADPSKPFDQAKAKQQLKDAAKDALDHDQATKDDLQSVLDALNAGRPADTSKDEETGGKFVQPTDAARRLHRWVGDALLDLKDQSEPGWMRRVGHGKINARRVLVGNDPEVCFDRYDPGQLDASELELVLLIDVSNSMEDCVNDLAEATWAIRQAVDDIDGKCTVLVYSDHHTVMARAGVRSNDRMFVPKAGGGTNPVTALREAFHVIAGSEARNRLVVILTDGEWQEGPFPWMRDDDPKEAKRIIDAINATGAITVLAFYQNLSEKVRQLYRNLGQKPPVAPPDWHHCQYGEEIKEPQRLADLFRRVAAASIGRWM